MAPPKAAATAIEAEQMVDRIEGSLLRPDIDDPKRWRSSKLHVLPPSLYQMDTRAFHLALPPVYSYINHWRLTYGSVARAVCGASSRR